MHHKALALALLVTVAMSCKKEEPDPPAPVPACQTNGTGLMYVYNGATDPYRLYYQADGPGTVEQLHGLVQPQVQAEIELPATVYRLRMVRDTGAGLPEEATAYHSVDLCDIAVWTFP